MDKRIGAAFCLFLAGFIFALCGCVTVAGARRQAERGDRIGAIETLSKMLLKNAADAEAVELFASLHPSTAEELLPARTVRQVREEFSAKYKASEIEAIRLCRAQSSIKGNPLKIPDIALAVSKSQNIISAYGSLCRIQKATAPLPRTIGNEKTGEYEVKKYSEDFSGLQKSARYELAEFYYNIAEAFFPGQNVEERTWLIDIYKSAASYYGGLGQTAQRRAELCYLNGADYESLKTVEGHKSAILWYKKSLAYYNGYKDVSERVQRLSYEIAMALAPHVQTKNDCKEVINYLSDAGTYKDAQVQLVAMKYYLAYLYRNDRTVKSYEEAGALFSELGSYKSAPYEASLYAFYKALKTLAKTHSYQGVRLLNGAHRPFSMARNIRPSDGGSASLSLSLETSDIDVYVSAMEKVIYPAAIINGEAIASQTFVPFSAGARNSVPFSLSSSGRVLAEGTIANPLDAASSVGAIRKAALLNSAAISPDYEYEFHTIYSPEDLEMTTGIGAGREKVSYAISASNWNPEKSYTLVKVSQKFYSAAIAAPALPVDFFAVGKNAVTASSLKSVTPYYVSSVDYGRKAFFVVSSNLSSQEIISDFEKCRPRDSKNSGAAGMRANSAIKEKWAKNATAIHALTVSEKIYSIGDLDGVYNWIKIGADMALEMKDLVPISFTLRNLLDNTYARLSEAKTVFVKIAVQKEVNESNTESSGSGSLPVPKDNGGGASEYDGDYKPGQSGGSSDGGLDSGSSDNNQTAQGGGQNDSGKTDGGDSKEGGQDNGGSQNQNSEGQNSQGKDSQAEESSVAVNGVSVPQSAYKGGTSLIFVGKRGYYTRSSCAVEAGSGVETWVYEIPQDEIQSCVASWSPEEFTSVSVNGISMAMNQTVYSFRDVAGNTISLDFVDASGKRIHNLLVVKKK